MNNVWVLLLGVWTSISVFSQNNFYDNLHGNCPQNEKSVAFDFEPDADSPNVEVAPLPVNDKDENIPVYQPPKTDEQSTLHKK